MHFSVTGEEARSEEVLLDLGERGLQGKDVSITNDDATNEEEPAAWFVFRLVEIEEMHIRQDKGWLFDCQSSFEGTRATITRRCVNRRYQLALEAAPEPLF